MHTKETTPIQKPSDGLKLLMAEHKDWLDSKIGVRAKCRDCSRDIKRSELSAICCIKDCGEICIDCIDDHEIMHKKSN